MKWTKCKDGMPRELGEYIITFIDSKGVKRSSVGSYSPNFKMWTRHGYLLETVIAWTLLPEPMSDENVKMVECISEAGRLYIKRAITPGNKYEVVGEDVNDYKVIDDDGNQFWYRKKSFK